MDKISAPWTDQQVESLNRYQEEGKMHPFTCGSGRHSGIPLRAENGGWVCTIEECDYTQDWAHGFQARWGAEHQLDDNRSSKHRA